ncbi:MAG: GNAT family N-acetyltransferase [Chitinophagaceae bacterium]|nr:GNAT family N-acetyltransferase [Chitinophagaceae bacterium]
MIHFDTLETFILEDQRVMLRPLQSEDLNHLLPYSEHEPEIWTYSLVSAAGAENMKKYIDLALQAKRAQTDYPFIVYDKQNQQYAGSTRFYDIQRQFDTLQLGYTWYGKAFQGSGINVHCKFLMLQFAFEQLGMHRVEFRADHNNARSLAAMKKIGCTLEGVLRENLPTPDGRRRDSAILSILKEEWFNGIKEKLSQRL